MIETLLQITTPPTPPAEEHRLCVQKDTTAFQLDMEKKSIIFTILSCEGEMLYSEQDLQSLVDAAVKKEEDKNKPKETSI